MQGVTGSAPTTARPAACFDRALCAVDGSAGSAVAVRHSIELANAIDFVAVTDMPGIGANRLASIAEHRARQALAAARALALDHGLTAEIELAYDDDLITAVRGRQPGHDLLAAGDDRRLHFDVSATSLLAVLADRAEVSLLVCRHGSSTSLARRVVVATGAEDRDGEPARIGRRLATSSGYEAHMVDVSRRGQAPWSIARLAEDVGASLVVIGRTTLAGVGEDVVEMTPCSVLVVSDLA